MPLYCHEKFTNDASGKEVLVCWEQTKHIHNGGFINRLKVWLADTQEEEGLWEVRPGSYQSNQSKCPDRAVEYDPNP